MSELFLVALFTFVAITVAVTELLAAVLPLLIVLAFVPPAQRSVLADLLAASDSSRRLRCWPALRLAVASRRSARAAQARERTVASPK